ncbi:coiled-coil domain-containing protein 172 isoform X1 [Channa argus]|uniref:coiled-coil domain-containing protein 172 isoform X1 n=1 Tax=Channa argus TaxID=215402 RepID=UPI00351F8D92
MRLQHDLMKKCEDQMLKQIEEILCQKSNLREHLIKKESVSKDEEQNFLQEISRFNDEFSLQDDRETVFDSQMHTEILDLEREVESLYKEIEQMSHSNNHMSSMQEEKRALQFELQGLYNNLKDLDRQLSEAEAMTDSLKAEILFVSQKPFTDSTCVRLRKELELHKEGELELLRETLSSEIQFLQSVSCCAGKLLFSLMKIVSDRRLLVLSFLTRLKPAQSMSTIEGSSKLLLFFFPETGQQPGK